MARVCEAWANRYFGTEMFKCVKAPIEDSVNAMAALCALSRFVRPSLNKTRLAERSVHWSTKQTKLLLLTSCSNCFFAQRVKLTHCTNICTNPSLPMGMPSVGQVLLRELPRELLQ